MYLGYWATVGVRVRPANGVIKKEDPIAPWDVVEDKLLHLGIIVSPNSAEAFQILLSLQAYPTDSILPAPFSKEIKRGLPLQIIHGPARHSLERKDYH